MNKKQLESYVVNVPSDESRLSFWVKPNVSAEILEQDLAERFSEDVCDLFISWPFGNSSQIWNMIIPYTKTWQISLLVLLTIHSILAVPVASQLLSLSSIHWFSWRESTSERSQNNEIAVFTRKRSCNVFRLTSWERNNCFHSGSRADSALLKS